MTCAGSGLSVFAGRCSACDRFAPVEIAAGAPMPPHTRARIEIADAALAAADRLSGDAARMLALLTKEVRP